MNPVVLKIIPEPDTRSFTVPETRTPPGSAFAMIPRRYDVIGVPRELARSIKH